MDVAASQARGADDGAALVVLASASPRRRELLWQIGVPHRVAVADIDEARRPGEAPEACVRRLALAKARRVHDAEGRGPGASAQRLPVLGADTAVVLGDDMLGKPHDRASALAMLARLSGRTHRVLTAVALVAGDRHEVMLGDSEVEFRALSAPECERYWESGEPRDKAGGYAIQGLGAVFVRALRGSYSGVMGLPLYETARLLAAAGVPCWRGARAGGADAGLAERPA